MRSTIAVVLLLTAGAAAAGGLPPSAVIRGDGRLTVLPVPHSRANTGVRVWAVVDPGELYEKGVPVDGPHYAHRVAPPALDLAYGEVEYPPASQRLARSDVEVLTASNERRSAGARDEPVSDEPPVYPGIGLPTTRTGSADVTVAMAAPPSHFLGPLDPETFMLTPIAVHLSNATIDEILSTLVPQAYQVSYDMKPDLRSRRYNVALETNLGQALADIAANVGVRIIPYHKLQMLLVTDRKD